MKLASTFRESCWGLVCRRLFGVVADVISTLRAANWSAQLRWLLSGVGLGDGCGGRGLDRRQLDLENRAAHLAVASGDFPSVLLNDSITGAQSQAKTLTHRSSGVEGIENARGLRDSWASISELNNDQVAIQAR